jgi:hypothetical protein
MFSFDTFFRIWVYLVAGVNFLNFVAHGANGQYINAVLSFAIFIGALIVSSKFD